MKNQKEEILSIVADVFDVPVEKIRSKGKNKKTFHARYAAIVFYKFYLEMTLKAIGAEFSNRDHATIIHSLKEWEKLFLKNAFRVKMNQANRIVSKTLNMEEISLKNQIDEQVKIRERKKAKVKWNKENRHKIFIPIKSDGIRSSEEMPTNINEWLKPLSKNNLETKETIKPVYF